MQGKTKIELYSQLELCFRAVKKRKDLLNSFKSPQEFGLIPLPTTPSLRATPPSTKEGC